MLFDAKDDTPAHRVLMTVEQVGKNKQCIAEERAADANNKQREVDAAGRHRASVHQPTGTPYPKRSFANLPPLRRPAVSAPAVPVTHPHLCKIDEEGSGVSCSGTSHAQSASLGSCNVVPVPTASVSFELVTNIADASDDGLAMGQSTAESDGTFTNVDSTRDNRIRRRFGNDSSEFGLPSAGSSRDKPDTVRGSSECGDADDSSDSESHGTAGSALSTAQPCTQSDTRSSRTSESALSAAATVACSRGDTVSSIRSHAAPAIPIAIHWPPNLPIQLTLWDSGPPGRNRKPDKREHIARSLRARSADSQPTVRYSAPSRLNQPPPDTDPSVPHVPKPTRPVPYIIYEAHEINPEQEIDWTIPKDPGDWAE